MPAPPPMLDDLRALITTRRIGRVAEFHATIDSTNRRAMEWAAEDAPHGAVVITDHQTAGRGRHGRQWADEPGLNLLFSVILRPALPSERLGLVTLAGAVAVAQTIVPVVDPLPTQLKWPNDVLVDGRKTCGMLLESQLSTSGAVVVLGIGLNVNQVDFPPELAERATSLRLATGRIIPRAPLLAQLLASLELWLEGLDRGEVDMVRSRFTGRMAGLGKTATVHVAGGLTETGTLTGIDASGALVVEINGCAQSFNAGEVTFRDEASLESK